MSNTRTVPTVRAKVRHPNMIPYFWAAGMSRRPKAERTSSKEPMEVMAPRDWRSLSRSERPSLLSGMVMVWID